MPIALDTTVQASVIPVGCYQGIGIVGDSIYSSGKEALSLDKVKSKA